MKPFQRIAAACAACVGLLVLPAQAQTYPAKPIRLVVPFAAGGSSDVIARLFGLRLSTALGQPVLIDNKAGAGGTVGAAEVARAPADGYTLLYVTAGHAGSAALYGSLPFDPVKDFSAVIGLAKLPVLVAVNANSKYRSMADLVADAKARPGKVNFAGGGGGATVTNLAGELFRMEAKLDVVNIPYKGSAPSLNALLAGEIDYNFDTISTYLGSIQGGKVRPLAVTTKQRSSVLPDVPTISESVMPGFDAYAWHGILAPRGTPQAIIDKLNFEFNAALKVPATSERLKQLGADPMGGTPAAFSSFVAEENTRWSAVIRKLGLSP